MRPGRNDRKTSIRIQGEELEALKGISYLLGECFGLDSRILRYRGARPIGLYSWDFECLIGGIEHALGHERTRQSLKSDDIDALTRLLGSINEVYRGAYG